MNVEVIFSEPQAAVLFSRKSQILEMAGKGSGKSETIGISSGTFISEIPKAIGFIGANTEMQLSQSTLDRVFKSWKKVYDFYEYDRFHKGGAYVVDKKPPPHFTQYRKLRNYHGAISFYNGGLIFIGSLENYKAHDGKEFAWAHLDETKDTKKEALKEVIQGRLRQYGLWHDAEGNIVFDEAINQETAKREALTAWNPLYIHTAPALMGVDWLNEMFKLTSFDAEIKEKVLREERDYFHKEFENKAIVIYSTHHNLHNLPPNYIENQKTNLVTEDAILKHVYGYPFSKSGGEYYPYFRRDQVVKKVHYNPTLPAVHVSLDFNVLPFMTMICAQIKYITRFIDEVGVKHDIPEDGRRPIDVMRISVYKGYFPESPLNTTEALAMLFTHDHDPKITEVFYYGDASGLNRIPGLGSLTNFGIFESNMRPYLNSASKRVKAPNISPLTRRDLLNKILKGDIPEVEIEIDEEVKELVDDLTLLKLGPTGKMKEKTENEETKAKYEKRGHPTDALEYLVCEVCKQYIKTKE